MEARQYTKEDGLIHCHLCNHGCKIHEGGYGICRVRHVHDNLLWADTYAKVSAEAIDPIEKKPLYHFLPGSSSYSLGSVGCNFSCTHCQNWEISGAKTDFFRLRTITPEEGVKRALLQGCSSISWTYNEPTLWYEYTQDMGKIAHDAGIKTIYVTNGYMTESALTALAPYLDAWRVDIKAFSEEFYHKVCKARLQPVLDSTIKAKELGLHIEVVNLIIPGHNDSTEEITSMIEWIINNLGPKTPVHFTRFHPDFKMQDEAPTPIKTLERAYNIAKEMGLLYPYLGNVPGHNYEDTWCPSCKNLIIKRSGYTTNLVHLIGSKCEICGEETGIIAI
jgi:pyruvate formate lyase activating enzyme